MDFVCGFALIHRRVGALYQALVAWIAATNADAYREFARKLLRLIERRKCFTNAFESGLGLWEIGFRHGDYKFITAESSD